MKLYLPGTLQKILAIQNLLHLPDEDIKKGLANSKTNFLNTNFHEYKILHIATHGIRAEEKTNVPVLLMSMVGSNNQPPDDGLLWYTDIVNKSIPVECAVLSSCHSTSGHYLRGEGSYAIAKAFFIAGAKSVLSTYWTLNDTDSLPS